MYTFNKSFIDQLEKDGTVTVLESTPSRINWKRVFCTAVILIGLAISVTVYCLS